MRRLQIPISFWIVLIASALYAGFSAWSSINKLIGLHTVGWDITNVTQAVWNTAHGAPFAMTNQYPLTNRLGGHVEPVILLLAPLAWVAGDAPSLSINLLILQAIVVACGAIPVYLLAKDKLKSSYGAVTFSLLYLLYPAVGSILSFEFHAVTLATGLWLWAIYCVQRQKWAGVVVFSLLALSCKENMSLILLLFGIYLAFSKQGHRVLGISLALTGGIWFVVGVFGIQPLFSPTGASVQMENYGWMGDSLYDKATLIFRDPQAIWLHVADRLQPYARQLLSPWGFTSVLSPLQLALILPELAVNLLSSKSEQQTVESAHYASALIPFVAWSAVLGMAWLQKRIRLGLEKINRQPWGRYIASFLFTLLLGWGFVYHYYRGYSLLSQNYPTMHITPHAQRAKEFASLVPKSSSILAQPNLGPFFSQNYDIYSDFQALPKVDFLLLDAETLLEGLHYETFTLVNNTKEFGLVKASDGYALFRRGADPRPLPDEFFDFARAAEADIEYPTQVRFGDALEFLGYDLESSRIGEPTLYLYVRALKPLDSRYHIVLYLLDGEGTLKGGSVEKSEVMIWYPMQSWRVGEIVKLRYSHFPWDIGPMQQFGYALGVLSDSDAWPDPWNVAARLRPTVVKSGWQGWLPADGTLLGFARLHDVWGIIKGAPPQKLTALPWGVAEREVALAEGVSLAGVNLSAGVKAGETTLPITLYWQAEGPTSTSYTTFVHLIDEQGAMVAQSDGIPGKGALPSTAWSPGEVIPDPRLISLPADMPSGVYTLLAGLYDATDGRRLPITDSKADARDNAIVIERMQISR
jgi:uncharacterized membrane protein